MKEKVLIVEPHSDDAMIGMGGYMLRFHEIYDFHFLLLTQSDAVLNHAGLVAKFTRGDEYRNYVDYFDGTWIMNVDRCPGQTLPLDCDGSLNRFDSATLVRLIEGAIQDVRPTKLFCCWPSFHQDHSTAYRALIAATRPTVEYCPPEIFFYENPTYVHEAPSDQAVRPTYYVDLGAQILAAKLAAIEKLFPSQVRTTGNALSANGIEAWARYRGIEARTEFAEAFFCLRQII
jgi:LmbE family N-acetylglucosaminyl deacetylase